MSSPDTTIDADFSTSTEKTSVDLNRAAWLATRPQDVENPDDFKALTAMYLTAGKGTGWGKDLTPAQARVLAVAAQTTGLNPLRGEIVMLGGNPYITEAGILRTADQNPQYDGYDLVPLNDPEERKAWGIDPNEIAFKCLVYRKDRSRPYIGVGHAAPKNIAMKPIADNWLSEMAQKRALERAHSRAFPAGLPTYDEQAMILPQIVSASVSDISDDFPSHILALAEEIGWELPMLRSQAKRFGDLGKLEQTMNSLAERGKQTARARAQRAEPEKQKTIAVTGEATTSAPAPVTAKTRGILFAALGRRGITSKADRLQFARAYGLESISTSYSELSEADARKALDILTVDAGALEDGTIDWRDRVLIGFCVACGCPKGDYHAKDCPIDEEAEA